MVRSVHVVRSSWAVVRASLHAPFLCCLTPRCARKRGPGGPPHVWAVVRATVVRSLRGAVLRAVVRATVVRSLRGAVLLGRSPRNRSTVLRAVVRASYKRLRLAALVSAAQEDRPTF